MTVKQCWNLIDREPFLAITWEPDFSQECSFCKMLMNHKNFNFTQIPDKTNDEIFLKSPKAMFLGHFWPFLVIFARWRFFPTDTALPHKTIYGPPTHVKLQKKLISHSRENLRTDGRTDGQTLFYRILSAEAGGPTRHWNENMVLYFWTDQEPRAQNEQAYT